MVSARVRASLAGLVLMLCTSTAFAQTTPTLTGSANGLNVSLTWTAVVGATGYDLGVSVNGGAPLVVPVGNITTLSVDVPPGSYQVAVRATAGGAAGQFSAPVVLTAAAQPPAPPAAPANLAAAINGNSVLLTWDLASTSGLIALGLSVGTAQGLADLGTFPIRVSNSTFLASIPDGNYFMRLQALGAGGLSAASNELNLAVPSCVPPATLPFTVTSNGSFVQASWPAVPGAIGYRLDASSTPGGGPDLASVPFGPEATNFSLVGAPMGTFYLTLHATMSCGPSVSSDETALTVTPPVRRPPLSEEGARQMVLQAIGVISAQYPGDLRNSCGNNTWMFRVLQYLRQQDIRFGLNWKRGHIGDLSQDVISYIFDDTPEELADQRHIWMWDVIIGHCGPSPRGWAAANWSFNIPERWTIEPYLRAGFAP